MLKTTKNNFHLIYTYIIYLILCPLFAQSDDNFNVNLIEVGLYFKNLHFDWKPYQIESDLHSLSIRDFKFSFSNIKASYTKKVNQHLASIKLAGPDLTVKDLVIKSRKFSTNWITQEKIKRLKKREQIPKNSIKIIANAIDLFNIDQNNYPVSLNELIIKKYLKMDAPPLNDYSWTYTLELPNQIIAKPTQINAVSDQENVIFDFQSRDFQVNASEDSLFNVPLVDWLYTLELKDIIQIFSSNVEIQIYPDSLNFDLIMKRGQFKISNSSFHAIPKGIYQDRSHILLPELNLETNDLILNGTFSNVPIIHRGSGKFRIRNFEIKIPEGLRQEPEFQSMLETMGIWNNSLMIRLIGLEINMINQFTGNISFKLHTPFLKLSIIGGYSVRQNHSVPEITLHNTEMKLHPISLGIKKWLNNWEKENGRKFSRKGATIVLTIDGPLSNPIIHGY